jgi:23S rRNA (uracil1939-C5)-methyltransferase
MSITKNQNYQFTITDLGTKGEGIGKVNNFTMFVKNTLPGDEIEAQVIVLKTTFAIGKLVRIITASPLRAEPKCPISVRCGGCQIMQMKYEEQLSFKEKKVTESLKRIGKIENPNVLPIIPMSDPYYYRNKAQLAFARIKDNIHIGLYTINTHNIIDTKECFIYHPQILKVLEKVRDFCLKANPSIYNELHHIGLLRHVMIRVSFSSLETMVVLVINGQKISKIDTLLEDLKRLPGFASFALNINTKKGDVILGPETQILWGKNHLEEEINGIKYLISPTSFFQVNPVQSAKMSQLVLEYAGLNGHELVWDLYSGLGFFSLALAKKAKMVIGVELSESAISDARLNADANKIKNVEFIKGDAETILPELNGQPDLIVIDPPRKGCDKNFITFLAQTKPKKVIYISCNPDTFARDANQLITEGFTLVKTQPIDMFPHTVHIETISLFER